MKDIPKKLDSKLQPKSSAFVTVHGDIADKMTVGEPTSVKILGKVAGVRPNDHHANHFDVEITEPEVEHIDEDGNYENLAKMPKEMLKKKISPTINED